MNLPNLSNVEIPKRGTGIFLGILMISKIPEFRTQVVTAALLAIWVLAQTYTDKWGKKPV